MPDEWHKGAMAMILDRLIWFLTKPNRLEAVVLVILVLMVAVLKLIG
jgi:di/tricarboxylate transporter